MITSNGGCTSALGQRRLFAVYPRKCKGFKLGITATTNLRRKYSPEFKLV